MNNLPLQGKTFVVLGSYPGYTNQAIRAGIARYGGHVTTAPHILTANYLVVNPDKARGNSITEQVAQQNGIPILNLQDVFNAILSGGYGSVQPQATMQYYNTPESQEIQYQYNPLYTGGGAAPSQVAQVQQSPEVEYQYNPLYAARIQQQKPQRATSQKSSSLGSCTIEQARDFQDILAALQSVDFYLTRGTPAATQTLMGILEYPLNPAVDRLSQRLQQYIESEQCPEEQQLARHIISVADTYLTPETIMDPETLPQVRALIDELDAFGVRNYLWKTSAREVQNRHAMWQAEDQERAARQANQQPLRTLNLGAAPSIVSMEQPHYNSSASVAQEPGYFQRALNFFQGGS